MHTYIVHAVSELFMGRRRTSTVLASMGSDTHQQCYAAANSRLLTQPEPQSSAKGSERHVHCVDHAVGSKYMQQKQGNKACASKSSLAGNFSRDSRVCYQTNSKQSVRAVTHAGFRPHNGDIWPAKKHANHSVAMVVTPAFVFIGLGRSQMQSCRHIHGASGSTDGKRSHSSHSAPRGIHAQIKSQVGRMDRPQHDQVQTMRAYNV